MKKKILLLARPDHSVNVYEYNLKNVNFYYATFNVTVRNTLISKLVTKGKCLLQGRVKNLILITFYNQMCRLLRRYGIDIFDGEGIVASKLAGLYLNLNDYEIVHYWPIYFTNLIKSNKNPRAKYIAEVYEANYDFAKDVYSAAYESNGMEYKKLTNKVCRYENLNVADIILVPSEFVKKTYEGYVEPRIKVIDFGLLGRETTNGKSTFDGKVLNLLFIGNATIEKGFDLLIKSSKYQSNFTVSAIGAISKEVESLDVYKNIKYLGKKKHDEVMRNIAKFDAVILPSYCDAFSMAVIEGLCHTKPVIVSSNCGNSSIIEKWNMGSVFESGSVESMISSINDVFFNYEFYRSNIVTYQNEEKLNPYPKRLNKLYENII